MKYSMGRRAAAAGALAGFTIVAATGVAAADIGAAPVANSGSAGSSSGSAPGSADHYKSTAALPDWLQQIVDQVQQAL